jgi:hypothetical protein
MLVSGEYLQALSIPRQASTDRSMLAKVRISGAILQQEQDTRSADIPKLRSRTAYLSIDNRLSGWWWEDC